jgi:Lipocalin-like domain
MRAAFVILLLLSSSALADDREKLLGNWKLVSFFTQDVQTKQRSNVFGEHPDGFAGITLERLFAFVAAEGRKAPQAPEEQAAAFRTVVAYTGKWRLEGEKIITKVDVAWNPAWVGTEQVRYWRVDGNKLFITTAPMSVPSPDGTEKMLIGTAVWEKEQ